MVFQIRIIGEKNEVNQALEKIMKIFEILHVSEPLPSYKNKKHIRYYITAKL